MAARNHPLSAKAIFHSDRGSNYTPGEFAKTMGSSYSASVEAAKTNISLRNLPAITGHITQERGQLLAGRQLGGVSSQLRKHEASPLRLNSYLWLAHSGALRSWRAPCNYEREGGRRGRINRPCLGRARSHGNTLWCRDDALVDRPGSVRTAAAGTHL